MNYPKPDAALIEAARANYDTVTATFNSTDASIATAEAAVSDAQNCRRALVERSVAGEDVPPATHRKIEATLRDAEAEVTRLNEIRALQESRRRGAEKGVATARAAAERPRVVHAIREILESGIEAAAAHEALRQANDRDEAARRVITDAFGLGFPMPPEFPRGAMPLDAMMRALGGPSENSLRRIWGDLANEALPSVLA